MELRRLFILSLLCSVLPSGLAAQDVSGEEPPPATPLYLRVGKASYRGDSIPHVTFPVLHKYPVRQFRNDRELRQYNRLVANVKKVLPLAKLARYTIIETYEQMRVLPDKKARAEHVRAVEAELKRTYTPMLKKMSRSQGRLLVKLIDRECNLTGYNIAKAFVGSFKANVYQTMAFCFGQSLNKRYDPEGEDNQTEQVVRLVESGQL